MMGDAQEEVGRSGLERAQHHSEPALIVPLPLPNGAGASVSGNHIVSAAAPAVVAFDRFELRDLLNLYGHMVAAGEWRDYAMDFTPELAIFSVFRRAHDVPLYRIEKNPKLARKQGQYVLKGAAGQVLKRGHELPLVLRFLDKPVKLVVG
jgi:Protein of unknown function (DUF2794)